nr:hypothetical protein [uncultured Flavobacterium sp.]
MSPSYRITTLVCFLLFSFAIVSAKEKIAQAYAIQMDVDSISNPLSKIQYGFRSYTQLPVSKAFQTTNTFLFKSNSSHRRGKGKAALPVL